MNNKRPLPAIVIFAVLTVVTVFVWIGFEIYRAFTDEAPPSVPPEVSAELNPTLDTAALFSLIQRIQLEDSEIGETPVVQLNSSAPVASSIPESTVESEIQEGTSEAEIVEEENVAQ